jgi:hypothetical protein
MAAAPEKTEATAQAPILHQQDILSETQRAVSSAVSALSPSSEVATHRPGQVQVIRRNGKVTHFDPNKIKVAMTKAFLAVEGGNAAASSRIHDLWINSPSRSPRP